MASEALFHEIAGANLLPLFKQPARRRYLFQLSERGPMTALSHYKLMIRVLQQSAALMCAIFFVLLIEAVLVGQQRT
jgi:hypothetical protein